MDLSKLIADRLDDRKWRQPTYAIVTYVPQPVTGILLSVEGLHNLEGKFENLDKLYAAGFAWQGSRTSSTMSSPGRCTGCTNTGWTPFGLRVLRAMEAKGMVIDVAHCSHTCVSDILRLAHRPVISSHGGVQATCKVNRN